MTALNNDVFEQILFEGAQSFHHCEHLADSLDVLSLVSLFVASPRQVRTNFRAQNGTLVQSPLFNAALWFRVTSRTLDSPRVLKRLFDTQLILWRRKSSRLGAPLAVWRRKSSRLGAPFAVWRRKSSRLGAPFAFWRRKSSRLGAPLAVWRRTSSRARTVRAGEVANAALEAITRRTTSRRKNWTIVENFYRSKKFSTPFHVVTRCAQNWTFWTDRPLCLQLTYIYFWTIWNLRPNFPELSKIYNTFCGQFWKIGVSADYIFQNCPQNVLYILDNSGKFGLRFQIVQKYIYVSWRQSAPVRPKSPVLCASGDHVNGVENFFDR